MIQPVPHTFDTMGDGLDPVCGMRLSERHAIRFTFGHDILLFCCADCLEHFRQHPEDYMRH